MARQTAAKPLEAEGKKEGILYGMLVCALGAIWLLQEMGIIKTDVPAGPIIIIVIGFLMLLPWLKR